MQGYHEALGGRDGGEEGEGVQKSIGGTKGSMTQRIGEIEKDSDRERERRIAKCGVNKRQEKERKKGGKREREREKERESQAERKDYIGDFGFRVSSGPKPISRFSVFPPWREPPLELDAHCTSDETRRDLPSRPLCRVDFVTSHIKSRSTL